MRPSKVHGGPLDTISAVGKAVSGRNHELIDQAKELLGQRGADRKIVDYARVFIALGDLETARVVTRPCQTKCQRAASSTRLDRMDLRQLGSSRRTDEDRKA